MGERGWISRSEYGRGYRDGWEARPADAAGGVTYRDGYSDGRADKAENDGHGPTWTYSPPPGGCKLARDFAALTVGYGEAPI